MSGLVSLAQYTQSDGQCASRAVKKNQKKYEGQNSTLASLSKALCDYAAGGQRARQAEDSRRSTAGDHMFSRCGTVC